MAGEENIIVISVVVPSDAEAVEVDHHSASAGCLSTKFLHSRIINWIYKLHQVLFGAVAAHGHDEIFRTQTTDDPIIRMMKDKELGKFVFNLGVTITISVLFSSSNGKPQTILVNFMLTGLTTGCVAIWNGILLREYFPRTSNVMEQVGIILVLVSFNGCVASALPLEFAWVPIICGCLFVVPFVLAALPPNYHHNQIANNDQQNNNITDTTIL